MKTRTKMVLGIAATCLLLFVIVIGAIGGWLYYMNTKLHDPARRAKMDKAWDDGKAFGKTTDQNGCMARGMSFTDSPDKFDLSNDDFDNACFDACSPSPGFCSGVEVRFGSQWPEKQCADGIKDREACISANERKMFACRIEAGM